MLDDLHRHSDGRIFQGPRGGVLNPDTVRTIFISDFVRPLRARFPATADEIGFQYDRLHSFRQFFIIRYFRW